MTRSLITLACLGGLAASAHADWEEVSWGQLPAAAQAAIQANLPGWHEAEFRADIYDGITHLIEARRVLEGRRVSIEMEFDGTVVKREVRLDAESIPNNVLNALQAAVPGGELVRAEINRTADNVWYEVHLLAEGLDHEVTINPDGTITEHTSEPED